MNTIYDLFGSDSADTRKVNPEQVADVINSLSRLIESSPFHATPDQIEFDESGTARIINDSGNDILYSSPESILGETVRDDTSSFFTFGLIIYFIIHGKSFYEDTNTDLLSLRELREERDGLITSETNNEGQEDVYSLYQKAMTVLTSWDPDKRKAGMEYVKKAVSLYSSTMIITYVSEGKNVLSNEIIIEQEHLEIPKGSRVIDSNGTAWKTVDNTLLTFRPGKHNCEIPVQPDENVNAMEDEPPVQEDEETVKTFLYYGTISIDLINTGRFPDELYPIFPIDNALHAKDIEITVDANLRYRFYRIEAVPGGHMVGIPTLLKEINIENLSETKACLRVTMNNNRFNDNCVLSLWNIDKSRKLCATDISFSTEKRYGNDTI